MTPDIRELLEQAARALEKELWWDFEDGVNVCRGTDGNLWNPLTGLADRARMEDALMISVIHRPNGVIATYEETTPSTCFEEYLFEHDNSRSAAHSMASLRVAAEIGRGMK